MKAGSRALLDATMSTDKAHAERSARELKHLAEQDASALARLGSRILHNAIKTQELRVRWNLIVVLGLIPLGAVNRLAAIDWLWERLQDASPFTRTFALQALWSLSAADPGLRERVQPVLLKAAEHGTAAMRARARRLLEASRKTARK